MRAEYSEQELLLDIQSQGELYAYSFMMACEIDEVVILFSDRGINPGSYLNSPALCLDVGKGPEIPMLYQNLSAIADRQIVVSEPQSFLRGIEGREMETTPAVLRGIYPVCKMIRAHTTPAIEILCQRRYTI